MTRTDDSAVSLTAADVKIGATVEASRRIGGYYGPEFNDPSIWEDSGRRETLRGTVIEVTDFGDVYWADQDGRRRGILAGASPARRDAPLHPAQPLYDTVTIDGVTLTN